MNTYQSFKAAVQAAFASNSINPGICYSPSRGWFTESKMHPADPDCVCRVDANTSPETGAWSVNDSPTAWLSVCEIQEIPLP